jgi:hypothetical protein
VEENSSNTKLQIRSIPETKYGKSKRKNQENGTRTDSLGPNLAKLEDLTELQFPAIHLFVPHRSFECLFQLVRPSFGLEKKHRKSLTFLQFKEPQI